MLEFLYSLHKKEKSYSCINVARSSLSAFVVLDTKEKIGTHPLVVRFMKGLFNLNPPKPRYTATWDVGEVLNLLRSWCPRQKLTLRLLTLKLCMLLALLIAPRSQTLKALKLSGMTLTQSRATFAIDSLLKTNRQGKRVGKLIEVQAYPPDRRLCPIFLLKEYVERTKDLRGQEDQLFISFRQKYGPVSTDTLARWVRCVLELAGVDSQFKAHSVRAASTSAASKAQVPIHEIMDKAGWTNAGTFRKFYKKDIVVNTYQEAILSKS